MVETPIGGVDARAHFVPSLPAGTVTFLLTDVEGSSRLWEADPEATSVALTRREEIIREATRQHGGVLPVEQGEGDSSVSVFARASDAAVCAVDIQRALGATAWPAGVDVRVRIALHTGEAEPPTDGIYRGAALNRCGRLRAIGHGGQILVSQATYEVLVDGLQEGLALWDLGVHRLRDLARAEHVWQLRHHELLDAFPPLRSLDAAANNLPVQLTSFVGRETEIATVRGLLADWRVVSLTGAGGCGKTRLAQQVAASMIGDCPDGIWWVDLAPLADPSLVPAAVAGVLGVRESAPASIADTVVGYLATSRALVVLDNCEHLIEACAALAGRLVECPSVTLLATSREPLRVQGELSWPVPPLSLPHAHEPGSLTQCEAVRLFVDRARVSQPSFSVTEDNARAVAEICTRLDGIPLAIELAAARSRVLTVDQIAAGLADRFHLLTGGARAALPRQRTLESSVDWSHDLLDETEQVVFRRLAAFAGSFTIHAAEAVCPGEGLASERVLDLLSVLVDRSLVQVAGESSAQARYRMLETIRDYARHKLIDAGDADATRERHLDYYVAFAEQAAVHLEGPALIAWLARIDAELDNLRAALDWSAHSADPRGGLRLVGLLNLYWFARSDLAIGRARLEATLDKARDDGLERADALTALCLIAYRAGDMVKAGRYGDEAVAIGRRLADARTLGRALHSRAWVRHWGEADRFAAWSEFEEATELFRKTDDQLFGALNLAMLAWSYILTSEEPRARALLDEGLALAEANGAPHARCYCHLVLGHLEMVEGRFADAAGHLHEALVLAHEVGDHYAEIFARGFITYTDIYRGRYGEAREQCELGLATALEHHSLNCEAVMRLTLGTLEFAEGHLDTAADELEALMLAVVFPEYAALPRAGQAQVALARSRPLEARRYAGEALRLGREADIVAAVETAIVTQAQLSRLDGDGHTAEDLCHDALELAYRLDHRPQVCDILESLGGAVADQGRFEEAARILGAAHAMREATGYARFPVHRPSHETDTAMLRHALGAGTFDEAWAEGAALTMDSAVAYARRGRGKRKRPAYGWNSLTPTELRVAELVADGLTNRQIGEKLFISPRTVQSHLSRVFTKLGVSTRAELAANVAKQGTP